MAKLGATGGIDRFTQPQTWTKLLTGETVYDNVRTWVRCEIIERVPAGESTVFIAHALQSRIERDTQPSEPDSAPVYHNRNWHRLVEHSKLMP